MDFRQPYLTDQLIAYIGSKRALLPFLYEVFLGLQDGRSGVSFLDPFAGTGAVSRLARSMGLRVFANDWEPYSFIINTCHLRVSASLMRSLFARAGGVGSVLSGLNALDQPPEDCRYIARHYAPRTTAGADWRTERLFYTTENALAIDAIRTRIEEMYPGRPADPAAALEKAVLLSSLLYECATHTNTSGVFKACHRGFGGHGKDALGRILAPIRLETPHVVDAPYDSEVFPVDALAFLAGRTADICYLDPPYSIHQYGSNYFMLNTIALWDKPLVGDARGPDGRLQEKAGIRSDWVRTRSAFCSRTTAARAMREVVNAADCRYLALSYSDEGIVELEELCDMLSETGEVSMHTRGYVKYPGGKQSIERTTRNVEVLLVADRKAGASPAARLSAAERLLEVRLDRLLACPFSPSRISRRFETQGTLVRIRGGLRQEIVLPTRWLYRFEQTGGPSIPAGALDLEEKRKLIEALDECRVKDSREEIAVLMGIVSGGVEDKERERLLQEMLRLLNRFAHRKYSVLFSETLGEMRTFAESGLGSTRFSAGLEKIAKRAKLRYQSPR